MRSSFIKTGKQLGAALIVGSIGIISGYAHAAEMPAVPDFIKSQDQLRVGVRCDQPPYGFLDKDGKHQGVEVDMAKQLAYWIFGSKGKANLTCVTAENRIPQLNGERVDLLIATLGTSAERAKVVDFTVPYRWGASGLLIRASEKNELKTLKSFESKKVAVLKGTVQAKWFEDHMPEITTVRLNKSSDALSSLLDNRVAAYAHDAATLYVMAAADSKVEVMPELFQYSDAAIGIRKNEPEWLAYLNASIARMKSEGLMAGWVKTIIKDKKILPYYIDVFTTERPDRK